jgi:hypothetical protein
MNILVVEDDQFVSDVWGRNHSVKHGGRRFGFRVQIPVPAKS